MTFLTKLNTHFEADPRVVDRVIRERGPRLTFLAANNEIMINIEIKDAETVKELRNMKIGGHVLTIEEAKGIDFDDIIVYNFFSSGTAVDKALEALNLSLETRDDGGKVMFPEMHRSQTVCEELKLLNVAITRARQRVFFFDDAKTRGAWSSPRSHLAEALR